MERNNVQIGDYAILRGNCGYNRNVRNGKPVLLCVGLHSCDENEQGTTLKVIMKPFDKVITDKVYHPDLGFIKERRNVTFVRVISTKTGEVYDVDLEWTDIFHDKKTYSQGLEFHMLDSALNEAFLQDWMDDPTEDMFWD